MKYKKIVLILTIIVIIMGSISFFLISIKKEGAIDKFLNEIAATTEIELYAKDNVPQNVNYKKIKTINDSEKISEIIELFIASKDKQSSNKDILLDARGHLIKFFQNGKLIAEYDEEKIFNEKEYVKFELTESNRLILYRYY